jgi:hypothetical protein
MVELVDLALLTQLLEPQLTMLVVVAAVEIQEVQVDLVEVDLEVQVQVLLLRALLTQAEVEAQE